MGGGQETSPITQNRNNSGVAGDQQPAALAALQGVACSE